MKLHRVLAGLACLVALSACSASTDDARQAESGLVPAAVVIRSGSVAAFVEDASLIASAEFAGNKMLVEVDGISIAIAGFAVASHDASSQVLVGQALTLSATGLEPESLAEVWLFSTPTDLGSFTVDGEGMLSASFTIDDAVEVGQHQLQIRGVSRHGRRVVIAQNVSLKTSAGIVDDSAVSKTPNEVARPLPSPNPTAEQAAAPPAEVRSVRVEARDGDGKLVVSWSPPPDLGGLPPRYDVIIAEQRYVDEHGDGGFETDNTGEFIFECVGLPAAHTVCVIGEGNGWWSVAVGLNPGKTHEVRVRARNSQGSSNWVAVKGVVAPKAAEQAAAQERQSAERAAEEQARRAAEGAEQERQAAERAAAERAEQERQAQERAAAEAQAAQRAESAAREEVLAAARIAAEEVTQQEANVWAADAEQYCRDRAMDIRVANSVCPGRGQRAGEEHYATMIGPITAAVEAEYMALYYRDVYDQYYRQFLSELGY